MLRYKLIKWSRRLRILLGGYKEMEEQHKLFRLFDPSTASIIQHYGTASIPAFQHYTSVIVEWLGEELRKNGYYYNVMSTTYLKQFYTVRKLMDMNHQVHLRFYKDGWVSGHYELRPEAHPLEHLEGVELRSLRKAEAKQIKSIMGGSQTHSGPKTMLTTSEVGQLLRIHVNTVRRWSNSGLLRAYRVFPRGDRRFRREDIEKFLEEGR